MMPMVGGISREFHLKGLAVVYAKSKAEQYLTDQAVSRRRNADGYVPDSRVGECR
jgi:hypothetical protein